MTSSVQTVEWLPERRFREDDQKYLWFHDSLHNNPPITPMGASVHHWPRGTQVASEYFQFPYSLGFSYVLQNGRIYPRPLPITDPKIIQRRESIFQQKLANMLENWPERYGPIL